MADGKGSFWMTLPGIITAVAGLLTATGALIATLAAAGVIGGSGMGTTRAADTGAGTTATRSTDAGTTSESTTTSQSGGCETVVGPQTETIRGTYLFDFDSGRETQDGADVWWDQHTETVRSLDPQNGATLTNLGAVGFDSISCDDLRSTDYTGTPINGNDDSTNELTNGTMFAVHTTDGNYAKVEVVDYGYNLGLRFETYRR